MNESNYKNSENIQMLWKRESIIIMDDMSKLYSFRNISIRIKCLLKFSKDSSYAR